LTTFIPIETPSLGDRSYLVHDGRTALVVDPQRDIDRVLDLAHEEDVEIAHVFETHIHNDYVTGGLALARRTEATYHLNAEDVVAYGRNPIRDGDVVEVSDTLSVRAIATPGHTFTHLSYAVQDRGETVAVCTGGSLLFGATGRPDLLGPEHTETLVHHQFASVQRLADEVPDSAEVLPTHGFGSFCSAGSASAGDASTIGDERGANPALTQDEERWVSEVMAGLGAFPAYYAHMAPANVAGPSAPDLSPPAEADRGTIARSIADGEWVVDIRNRTAYAAGHVAGTLNFGSDGQFATYLGWLIPWGTPLTLLGESPEQVAEAQRELVRIGIDRLEGAASGEPSTWTDDPLARLATASFPDLEQVRHHRPVLVLDVRQDSEYDAGHVEDALNIPLHELPERHGEVAGREVWVHCATGYRASIAAALLASHGATTVLVDDDFDERARPAGLPISAPAAA
jgi:hydroxyacylglutathione hydrolase